MADQPKEAERKPKIVVDFVVFDGIARELSCGYAVAKSAMECVYDVKSRCGGGWCFGWLAGSRLGIAVVALV